MKATARFYGYIRQAIGHEKIDFDLPSGSTLADLVRLVQGQDARMSELLRPDERGLTRVAIISNGMVCLNSEWAATPLREDTVVQFLPPVIGGGDNFSSTVARLGTLD